MTVSLRSIPRPRLRVRPLPTPPLEVVPPPEAPEEVHYPSSDGRPMGENTPHRRNIVYGSGALEVRHVGDPNVCVESDLMMYYEEGNKKAVVAPDVLVAFGVEKRDDRQSYKVWEEGKVPDFVLEVASEGTWRDDEGRKRDLYERLGVQEYWQFDPTGKYLDVALKGHRLRNGKYERIAVKVTEDGSLWGYCPVLGVWLRAPRGGDMRYWDPETGLDLPSLLEEHVARRMAEARAEREAEARRLADLRAEQAGARIAELEALLRDRRE